MPSVPRGGGRPGEGDANVLLVLIAVGPRHGLTAPPRWRGCRWIKAGTDAAGGEGTRQSTLRGGRPWDDRSAALVVGTRPRHRRHPGGGGGGGFVFWVRFWVVLSPIGGGGGGGGGGGAFFLKWI